MGGQRVNYGFADKVVCYFGSWSVHRQGEGKFDIDHIDPHLCTHLIFAFVGINDDANIRLNDEWHDKKAFEKLQALKKVNNHLKVMVSVGGWKEGSKIFSQVLNDIVLRELFIINCVYFVKQHHFDGLDFDWEYPAVRGGQPSDRESFAILIRELREEFDKLNLTLTAAVAMAPTTIRKSYNVTALIKYLDWLNLMSYGFHDTKESTVGHNAPLYPSSADKTPNAKILNIHATLGHWLKIGVPPNKLVLGIGAFGLTYRLSDANQTSVGSPAVGPGNPGPFTYSQGILCYTEIILQQWNYKWDKEQQVPYGHREDQWVGFDDPKSVEIKVNYSLSLGLLGFMIWTIDNDDFNGITGEKYPILKTLNGIEIYKNKTFQTM